MGSTIAGLISLMLNGSHDVCGECNHPIISHEFTEVHSPIPKDFTSSLTSIAINFGIALGSSLGVYVVKTSN